MPRDVYSFIKVRKEETDRGIICAAMGIATFLCLIMLIAVSFAGGGNLPPLAGAIGYLSMTVSLASFYMAYRLRNDSEAYGRMVGSCIYVCLVSAAAHVAVFLIGCFAAIAQA